MVNKQRVQRIRNIIYSCIVLVIFIPIILIITLCFRMIGLVDDLMAYLQQAPQTSAVEPVNPTGGEESPAPQNQSLASSAGGGSQPMASARDIDASIGEEVESEREAATTDTPEVSEDDDEDPQPTSEPGGGASMAAPPASGQQPSAGGQPQNLPKENEADDTATGNQPSQGPTDQNAGYGGNPVTGM